VGAVLYARHGFIRWVKEAAQSRDNETRCGIDRFVSMSSQAEDLGTRQGVL
jgi:hypothetical protein